MNNLFRFILLRPPETRSASEPIQTEDSPFVEKIRQAGKSANPVEETEKVIQTFLESSASAKDVSSLVHFQHLSGFIQALSAISDLSVEKVNQSITSIFNKTAAELITDQGFLDDKRRIQETLIALKLKNESPTANLALLKRFACAIDLMEQIASQNQSRIAESQLRTILQRQIVIPDEITLPGRFSGSLFPEPDPSKNKQRLEKREKLNKLHETYRALLELDSDSFQVVVPHQQLFDKNGFLTIANRATGAQPPSVTLSLKPAIAARLSPAVSSTLADLRVDLATTPLTGAVNQVFSLIIASVISDFGRMPPDPEDPTFEQPPKPVRPTSHGSLNPIGIADLLVVKQQLIRYERGEVAHIENIVAGESFKRAVTRSETEDTTIVSEAESAREEERDLQSTLRFELQEEVRSVVTADGKLKPGAPLSPAYGPMLEFTSDKDNPAFGSLDVSMSQAASHGRDVTERATSRITERIRRQLTQRLVRTFEEKTEHSFTNIQGGSKNICGVYQWIDKIYQAQVYNYGKRLFYDFTIPEPGAFILSACEVKRPTKPIPLTWSPPKLPNSIITIGLRFTMSPGLFRRPPRLEPNPTALIFLPTTDTISLLRVRQLTCL